jgi:hypothetical protein
MQSQQHLDLQARIAALEGVVALTTGMLASLLPEEQRKQLFVGMRQALKPAATGDAAAAEYATLAADERVARLIDEIERVARQEFSRGGGG